jgi:hypothetical protein
VLIIVTMGIKTPLEKADRTCVRCDGTVAAAKFSVFSETLDRWIQISFCEEKEREGVL